MCIPFMPAQSCDLIRASDWRALYVARATRTLYTFGQTPSFRVRERGLGTRLVTNKIAHEDKILRLSDLVSVVMSESKEEQERLQMLMHVQRAELYHQHQNLFIIVTQIANSSCMQ